MALRTLGPGEQVTEPGFYRMTSRRYHEDPVAVPSLSSSVAVTLLDNTPSHAKAAHPRLTPPDEQADRNPQRNMEIGSAAHALLLGQGENVVVIDAKDYKAKDAQAQRAEAYASGDVPILQPDLEKAERMVARGKAQILAAGFEDFFDHGESEIVMVWKDQAGPWCRVMADRLQVYPARAVISDLKTSGTAVNPAGLGWKIVDLGYEMRAAFYERGLAHLLPELAGRIDFQHLWLETDEPHALVATALDGAALSIGRQKAAAAIGLWHRCLTADEWPGYAPGVHRVEYPQRAESAWMERCIADDALAAIVNLDPFLSLPALNPDRARHQIDPAILERGLG